MSDTFWLNNPLILVDKNHITEIFPIGKLSYIDKLNALTRLIIILSILGYFMTKSGKIVISAAVTIVVIAIIYKIQKHKTAKISKPADARDKGHRNRRRKVFDNFSGMTRKPSAFDSGADLPTTPWRPDSFPSCKFQCFCKNLFF